MLSAIMCLTVLCFSLTRKVRVFRPGGEGSPNLVETLQNLAVNGAAVAILGFVFQRDLRGSQSDRKTVEREEALARLQVDLSYGS